MCLPAEAAWAVVPSQIRAAHVTVSTMIALIARMFHPLHNVSLMI
jgi:hypothetical protein